MNTNNVMNAIAKLDLEPVKTKLMHVASGEGWSRAKVDALDVEYRRFLYLSHAFPNEEVAPTVDVDTFWHYHILDTAKYAADCDAIFGYFLHHYPYLGLESDADMGAEQRGGERMRELYEQTFGVAYIRAEVYGTSDTHTAFCTFLPQIKTEGAQSAFCTYRPNQKKTEGAQSAFCTYRPNQEKTKGAQSAFCTYRPNQEKTEGAQLAFCTYRPGQEQAAGGHAAMRQNGAPKAPVRPAIAASH